ncbi:MAG: thermonuclease family protein [Planctomycetaceae bacterium]
MRLRRWPNPSLAVLLILGVLAVLRMAGPRSPPDEAVFTETNVKVARVVDGDTLLLESGHRVRLIGVDTPETKHPDRPAEPLGPEASRFTSELIGEGEGEVRLEFDRERRDQYRRLLAYVFLPDGRLLNEEIIRAGLSEAKTYFPFRSDRQRQFTAAEAAAKAEHLGIWAAGRLAETAP